MTANDPAPTGQPGAAPPEHATQGSEVSATSPTGDVAPGENATPTTGVTLELTGPLERVVGCGEVTIPAEAEDRLGRVVGGLVRRYPDAATLLAKASFFDHREGSFPPGFLVIRDGAAIAARLETPVAAGERLTLMPMISGG